MTEAAPAPINGTLDLLSNPAGVSVEIDGTPVGNTPLVGIELTPGIHQLRLHGPDLKPLEQNVEIQAGQTVRVSLSLGQAPPKSESFLGSGVQVPLATVLLSGTAAVLFGVGLGFGIAANDVQHQVGVNVSASGVDLGLTRAQALQGKQDAMIANGFYIGASAALVAAIVVAIVAPHPRTETPPPAASIIPTDAPASDRWVAW